MRASRLLSILLLLQARGRTTAARLAEEFEVSIRTIYRDMDDLSAAGVPVFADRGSSGGFELLDGYETQLTGLTVDEAGALFLFGLPHAAADLGLGQAMAAARRKIDAALPDNRRRGADRVATRFHLDTTGWFKPIEKPELLPALANAVWADRRIRMRYRSWNGESEREVSPVGLVLKSGVWYMVAFGQRGAPATYRVSSIQTLEVTDHILDRPEAFDLSAYWSEATQQLAARLQQGTATLSVSQRGYELVDKLGVEVARAAESTRSLLDEHGWSVIHIPVERTENAVCDILSLGMDATLLGPKPLINALQKAVEQLTQRYARS